MSKTPAERPRILIVDDSRESALMLAAALALFDYETATAHDPTRAASIAASFAPHLAVLDIGLPVMDGVELGKRLLAATNGIIRLIALTGYSSDRYRNKALATGFDAYLIKPAGVEQLQPLIEQLLLRS